MKGKGTVHDLLIEGKKVSLYKYVVHSTATKMEQVQSINNYIAEIQRNHPEFIGFGTLHPQLVDMKAEADRIIALGLQGVKLHPEFQNFNIDDLEMMPVYKAVEGKLPILMHMGDENRDSSSPQRLRKVLELFPRLTFVAAHLGGYQMWDESMEYLVGENVYLDTSSSLYMLNKERAKEIIRRHGVHKVLFGSDYPMWSIEEELQRFLDLELTQEEQELILWKNASSLLHI
jgi:predicted TIM-barrel fold metal-dependent hydrolase